MPGLGDPVQAQSAPSLVEFGVQHGWARCHQA